VFKEQDWFALGRSFFLSFKPEGEIICCFTLCLVLYYCWDQFVSSYGLTLEGIIRDCTCLGWDFLFCYIFWVQDVGVHADCWATNETMGRDIGLYLRWTWRSMIEGICPTGEDAGTRREYKGSGAHKMTVLFATTGHILAAAVTVGGGQRIK
jgi:hypothetical protein